MKVNSLSRVRLLATKWTAAYQAPPSMGFSRREYWNGLPLPSPFTKYMCVSCSVMSDSPRSHGPQPTRLLHPWDFPGKSAGVGCHLPSPKYLSPFKLLHTVHTVHGVLKARILKWFAIPFSSGPHSVRPLHHDPPVLGCPVGIA